MVKVRHVAINTTGDTPEALKVAYEGCLHQIIGHFMSNDVVIENSLAVQTKYGVVTMMIGYREYTEAELEKIRAANREYAKEQKANVEEKHGG